MLHTFGAIVTCVFYVMKIFLFCHDCPPERVRTGYSRQLGLWPRKRFTRQSPAGLGGCRIMRSVCVSSKCSKALNSVTQSNFMLALKNPVNKHWKLLSKRTIVKAYHNFKFLDGAKCLKKAVRAGKWFLRRSPVNFKNRWQRTTCTTFVKFRPVIICSNGRGSVGNR